MHECVRSCLQEDQAQLLMQLKTEPEVLAHFRSKQLVASERFGV